MVGSSCDNHSVVLDPFCGCATTCVACEIEGRQWVGIDISPKAYTLVQSRLKTEVNIGEAERYMDSAIFGKAIHRTDIPKRTDLGKIPPYNCKENRAKLYFEQSGNCNGCGTYFEPRHFEVDHIIAETKGGPDYIENLQLLCSNCNRIKGDRGMEYLKTKLQI